MKRNILVTGANGQLGRCLQDMWAFSKLHDNVFWTDYDELDITDQIAVNKFIHYNEIDIVINCAAYTNVDKAEDDYNNAYKLNALGPAYLAEAIQNRNGFMIHISTDYVFGNKQLYNTPFGTYTKGLEPSSVYGKTKLDGEEKIFWNCKKFVIIRTAWLYSEYGNNFMKTMLKLFDTKDEIKVVYDQVGSPTYAGDLACAIIDIYKKYALLNDKFDMYGVYNYSNEGVCSWYDFAKAIQDIYGYKKCRINPCLSSEFESKVDRPHYSVLDKSKIKKTFFISVPYWRESLEMAMDSYFKQNKNI